MKAIQCRYLGPTNTKGSRIVAWVEGGHRVIIPYPYDLNGDEKYEKAARDLCNALGWDYKLIGGGLPNGDRVFVLVAK